MSIRVFLQAKNIFARSSSGVISCCICNNYRSPRSLSSSPNRDVQGTELQVYGQKKQTPVTLKALLETGKGEMLHLDGNKKQIEDLQTRIRMQIAAFLHRELPVRLGKISLYLFL